MKHWQKKELFHVKHHPDRRTLYPFHARLNFRRKAAGFILRMFQLHDRRSSAVGSMFRLVISESVQAREDAATLFDTRPRVPTPTPYPSNPSLQFCTAPHPAAVISAIPKTAFSRHFLGPTSDASMGLIPRSKTGEVSFRRKSRAAGSSNCGSAVFEPYSIPYF